MALNGSDGPVTDGASVSSPAVVVSAGHSNSSASMDDDSRASSRRRELVPTDIRYYFPRLATSSRRPDVTDLTLLTPTKKRKVIKMPIEALPPEAVQIILSFVDSARDLLTVVSTIPSFRDPILSRPDIVIRAAIFTGGATKSALDSFFDEIPKRRIHTPSTMRLLRLLNAVRCERDDWCLEYDPITERSQRLDGFTPNMDWRRPFGLALCPRCYNDVSCFIDYKLHWAFIDENLLERELLATDAPPEAAPPNRYRRISDILCGRAYYDKRMHGAILRHPMVDTVTGEAVGSVLAFDTVVASFKNRPESVLANEDPHAATKRTLNLLVEFVKETEWISFHLRLNNKKVHDDNKDESVADNTNRIADMVRAYEEASEAHKQFEKDKRKKEYSKNSARRAAPEQNREHRNRLEEADGNRREEADGNQREETDGNRREEAEVILNQVKDIVEISVFIDAGELDLPGDYYLESFPWLFHHEFDDTGRVSFAIRLVDEILGNVIRTRNPNQMRLEEVAERLFRAFAALERSGLLEVWDWFLDD